jgi:hypothetical protein
MNNVTRDTLEAELQKDLEELEMKGKPRKKTTAKKSSRKKAAPKKSAKKKTVKKTTVKPAEKIPIVPLEKKAKEPDAAQELLDAQAAEDQARSQKVFLSGLALVIILFVALLVGGKYLAPTPQDPNVITYNDITFTKDVTHWSFQWERQGVVYTIPLRFNPQEVEDLPIQGVLDPKFNKQSPIYITFDPVSNQSDFTYLTLGAGELSFNLVQALGKQVEAACAVDDNGPACANRTIVNCDNSDDKAVVFLKTAEPAGIFIQDTCIVLQGSEMDLLKSIDRLLYEWYGIID